LCDRKPEAVESSIKAIFLKKAKQLDGRIRDFLAGAYSFDGVDVGNVKRIFPIIVTEQSVPQVISLWRRIREVIAEHGFLQDWECANFACAEEIEMLFMGSDGRLDLEGILTRKAVSPYAQRDITLYLAGCERERLAAKTRRVASRLQGDVRDGRAAHVRTLGVGLHMNHAPVLAAGFSSGAPAARRTARAFATLRRPGRARRTAAPRRNEARRRAGSARSTSVIPR
jgi:hypothetical protein